MAFCTNCGAEVKGPFCGNCGAPAQTAAGQGAGTAAAPPAQPASPAQPAQPAQPFQAVQPPPQPVAPAAVPQAVAKSSALVWILGGCGGLIVLGGLIFAIGVYYVGHKAKQYGDLAQRNPALAAVKMMVALNPAVEIASIDEDKGLITLREKKTGKTLTMNLDEAQKGKFVFSAPGEKPVTIEAHGDGATGSFEMKSADGSVKLGSGAAAKLPGWVPNYPESAAQGNFSMQNASEESGTVGFTTKDSVEQVVKYYEDSLKSAGLTPTTNVVQSNGKASVGIVTGEQADGKRKVVVNATLTGEGTSVGVTYTTKP